MGGSSVWDGTLSPDEFNASAKALVTKWGEIDVDDSLPDWAWRPSCRMGVPSQTEGFVALEGVCHTGAGSETEESNDLGDGGIVEFDTWVSFSVGILAIIAPT
uniref:Uncharacterized protein n=1 Tax=Avena sativa TaxID=4498 RepID=A0ACD5US43_AVESA